MKMCHRLIWLALFAVFPVGLLAGNQTPSVDVSRLANIKAAYVYNILKFTRWPENLLPEQGKIRVGLLGNDPVISVIEKEMAKRLAQQRQISVERISEKNDNYLSVNGQPFHLIYVGEQLLPDPLLESLRGEETLLVGGDDLFVEKGGMVSVVYDPSSNHVLLKVNLSALEKTKFVLSSQLLAVAEIVETKVMPL